MKKRLCSVWSYGDLTKFCTDILAATCIPFAVQSPPIDINLRELLGSNLADTLDQNIISIYHDIYVATKNQPALFQKCQDYIETEVGDTMSSVITSKNQDAAESTLMYFNKSPEFVTKIFAMIAGSEDDDLIADCIDERLLGGLIAFEVFLTTKGTENFVNQYILNSMSEIIEYLGPRRISKHCGIIIAVLNSAVKNPSIRKVKDLCIKVWRTLIRVCDVAAIGVFLSTIFVSLESFIDEYPDEVNRIISNLIVGNSNLLSVQISDLFFIEKTKYNNEIKQYVTSQMNSQKLKEFGTFRSSLETLLRHLKNENADVKIKIYALKYLKKLLNEKRADINNLINSQLTMDPIVEELLLILMMNCKNNNSSLQAALAECIGELGAIEPNLRQQSHSSVESYAPDVMSEMFAIAAMKVLCQSYQQKNDSKFVITVQLGIQKLLQLHGVTKSNLTYSPIWQAIPEKMRHQMIKLCDTKYKPKDRTYQYEGVVFWNSARTYDEWIHQFSTKVTIKMQNEEVKSMFDHLLPSIKGNQYTTSLFLPYMILHSVEEDEENVKILSNEFQFIFNAVLGVLPQATHDVNDQNPHVYAKLIDYDSNFDGSLFENNMKPLGIKAAKLIFEMFDFLVHYNKTVTKTVFKCENVRKLLDGFSFKTLAKVNFECEEYARAMIYLEKYLSVLKEAASENDYEIQETLKFLARIYSKLDNVDAVIGVLSMKTAEWPLIERISVNNMIGNFQDSSACCKQMVEEGHVKDIEHVQEIVNCYVSLDEPGTALMIFDELMKTVEIEQAKLPVEIRSEPLWRLSRFDEMTDTLKDEKISESSIWGVQCSKLLLSFRNNSLEKEFSKTIRDVRQTLMKNLKITGSEQTAYEKNYRNIINLHLICDLEKASQIVEMLESENAVKTEVNALQLLGELIDERNERMEIVQKNPQIEEPMLCFYRVVLDEISDKIREILNQVNPSPKRALGNFIDRETGKLWNQSIKVALNNKMYQQAQSYILSAENYDTGELFMLKSKLHWLQGDQNTAIKTLNLGIAQLVDCGFDSERSKMGDKRIYAEAKLMIARYNAEAMNYDVETCKQMFMDAVVKGLENEKHYLQMAEYLDRHYSNDSKSNNKDEKIEQVGKPEQMLAVMTAYHRSLKYGSNCIYQSMPRFLSVWLDTSAMDSSHPTHKNCVNQMNKIAEEAALNFNSTYFYTALSQILSRLCHNNTQVYAIIKKIVTKLIEEHTQQVLWYLVPMLNSSVAARKAKVVDILKGVRNHQTLIDSMKKLVERFQNFAFVQPGERIKKISLKDSAKPLLEFLKANRGKFILPFEFNLQLNHVGSNYKFSENTVTIHDFHDQVEVMSSLQKPKKVIIIGSNGQRYPSLFKTQDDLRIDLRFMEVSSVLKGLLLRDPESRQRQLTTRTYSVIPMSEKAGIIEWVPNLCPMKAIISSEYTKINHLIPIPKDLERIASMTKEQQIREYRKHTKESFPSVLADYYSTRFPTPQNYYKARTAFIKSTAAWSIIGYILGLGDRHCENILIDICTGETFHVDCNMLFNRGEQLSVPETVPFR